MQTIQTIFTPFGVMPLTEQSLASSYFKFWVGHTNFKITTSFHKIISDIDGVETLDIFSPYRFRISVAKLFRDRDVMSNIRKSMVSYAKGQKMKTEKKDTLNSSDVHDTSLIMESREIFLRGGSSQDEPAINHIVAEKFLINLRILEQSGKDPVIIHQQTVGGDWHSGICIYDAIKNSPCKFVFICHGICASMGSIIAQAPFNKE